MLHPYLGALAWVVFGLLNPHRLAFGPAYDFPFAMLIGILTLVGIVVTRDHRQLKGGTPAIVLIIFLAWTSITTMVALTPENALPMWNRVMKVMAMTFVLMFLLHTKRHVEMLVGAIAVSIGFYGVKGGIFTIVTGGGNMVYGPWDSVMMGNNSLGVANVMTIPLVAYFYQQATNRWVRWGLLACILHADSRRAGQLLPRCGSRARSGGRVLLAPQPAQGRHHGPGACDDRGRWSRSCRRSGMHACAPSRPTRKTGLQ